MLQHVKGQMSARDLLECTRAPGAQYIMIKENDVMEECYAGYADLVTRQPVNGSTTFNNFSVTKTVTAAAIMQLTEQKKIHLSDPVTPLFDEFRFSYPFTIGQLVAHQAGFPDPIPITWIHLASEDDRFEERDFISQMVQRHAAQKFLPGSRFSYSSIGYLLLSRIIEKISGMTYVRYVMENVLPSINDNGFLGFKIEDQSLHATGYHPRYSFSGILLNLLLNRKKFIQYDFGPWTAFHNFYVNGKAYGGLIGNVKGLAAYLRALLTNLIFSDEETRQLMFREQMGGMSYGWFTGNLKGKRYVCHAGGGGGYYCEIRIYPDIRVASALLRNRSSFGDLRLLDKLDGRHVF